MYSAQNCTVKERHQNYYLSYYISPVHHHELTAHTHTHTRLMALCPGLPRWAGTRKVKPIWILLKQETVCGSGISWAICQSAPRSGQITMPAPHHSVFYRPDALPAAQRTASKHWRQTYMNLQHFRLKVILNCAILSRLNYTNMGLIKTLFIILAVN